MPDFDLMYENFILNEQANEELNERRLEQQEQDSSRFAGMDHTDFEQDL